MSTEPYTPTTDEMLDGYVTMKRREIPGDPILASIQALSEAVRWLAAHDAEVRAGVQGDAKLSGNRGAVVAEAPEWEYRTLLDGADPQPHGRLSRGEITPAEWFANRDGDDRDITLERRKPQTPAGPWVPVKQEGADDA